MTESGTALASHVTTQRDDLDFNLACIGPDIQYQGVKKKEEFDTPYMRAPFDYAFRPGKGGYPWKKLPPGLDAPPGHSSGS